MSRKEKSMRKIVKQAYFVAIILTDTAHEGESPLSKIEMQGLFDKMDLPSGVIEKKKARLSKLSEALRHDKLPMRIVFDGKVKGGQGTVKLFTIQTPSGLKF